MKPSAMVLLAAAAGLLAGCSGEAWERAGYETLQSLRQQECRAEPGEPCPVRQQYEDYRRSRSS